MIQLYLQETLIDGWVEYERVCVEVRRFNVSFKLCNLLNKVAFVTFIIIAYDYYQEERLAYEEIERDSGGAAVSYILVFFQIDDKFKDILQSVHFSIGVERGRDGEEL